jgi:polyisoprenoid-binding protein YceI
MFGLATVHGTFRLRSGEMNIAADPTASTVQATLDSASFASGNARRDRDVSGPGLLDAAAHPDITFTSQQTRQHGDGWTVTGSVTAHGTSDPVEVLVDRTDFEGETVNVHATARLDRTRLGVTKKKGMVGRDVEITIDAVALPA